MPCHWLKFWFRENKKETKIGINLIKPHNQGYKGSKI